MREWPLRIIHYLTGFLILSSVHCLFASLAGIEDKKTFIYTLIYFPIVILLSEGQKKVIRFWQFLLFAGAGLLLVYLAGGSVFDEKMGAVLTVGAAASYFYARASRKKCWLEEPIYPFLALYIIMILLEMRYQSELLRNYALYGAGAYYLLCMYKNNIDEMNLLMKEGKRLEIFSAKRLFLSNYLMMGIQTVIVGLGMFASAAVGMEGKLSQMLWSIRNGIARFLRRLESEELSWGAADSAASRQMPTAEMQEMSPFLEILMAVGEVLGWFLVIGITLFAFFKILKKLYQLYLAFDVNSAENGDEIEQILTVNSKEEKSMLKKQKKQSMFQSRTEDSKIRKAYKKQVLRGWNGIPDAALTPTELEARIIMEETQKQKLHDMYEKARYSKESQ